MTIMNLNDLSKEAFSIAKANGWHEQEHSDEHFLMLIITEIAEAVQADRKGKHADVSRFKECQTYYNSFLQPEEIRTIRFREDFEEYIKNTVEDELSDVVIRCLDLAGLHDMDLQHTLDNSDDYEDVAEYLSSATFAEIAFDICSDIISDGIEGAVSKTILHVVQYCKVKGIDIGWFITQKMKYNRLRGYHHGGKKY